MPTLNIVMKENGRKKNKPCQRVEPGTKETPGVQIQSLIKVLAQQESTVARNGDCPVSSGISQCKSPF